MQSKILDFGKLNRVSGDLKMSDLEEIRNRLEKLREFNKEQNKQSVTDDQLQEKLRRLKGLDSAAKPEPNYFVPVKFKSEVEATDELFKQLCDEVDVDNKFRGRYDAPNQSSVQEDDQLIANLSSLPSDEKFDANFSDNFVSRAYDRTDKENRNVISQEELEKELGLIKNKMREFNYEYKDFNKNASDQTNSKANTKKNNFDDQFDNVQIDSSDDEANYIDLVRKFVDEAKLETTDSRTEEDKPRGSSDDKAANKSASKLRELEDSKRDGLKEKGRPNDPEEEKLDFCYICSEDAALVCIDCDRERFCVQCFKEFHEDLEYRSHRYARFNPKK